MRLFWEDKRIPFVDTQTLIPCKEMNLISSSKCRYIVGSPAPMILIDLVPAFLSWIIISLYSSNERQSCVHSLFEEFAGAVKQYGQFRLHSFDKSIETFKSRSPCMASLKSWPEKLQALGVIGCGHNARSNP